MSEITLSEKAKNIRVGIYEHYKKKRYEILGVAIDSETLEEKVIYNALYGENLIWVRPLDMFFEEIEIDGIKQFRFVFIEPTK